MKLFGEMNGEVKYFSHVTKYSKGVGILINPLVQDKIESGKIVLITIVTNSLMLSLCNVHNQAEQLEFLQE